MPSLRKLCNRWAILAWALAIAVWNCPHVGSAQVPAPSAGETTAPQCKPFNVLIRGQSLAPRIAHGATLRALPLGCGQPVQRGSVVIVKTGASAAPLAKVVKALPGDLIAIEPAGETGSFNLRIAGELAQNSEGRPYLLRASAAKVLQLYERDYGGRIPANSLLILGDNPTGTLDSTRFGLVSHEAVIGVQVP